MATWAAGPQSSVASTFGLWGNAAGATTWSSTTIGGPGTVVPFVRPTRYLTKRTSRTAKYPAASTLIHAGTIACVNASGLLTKGAVATTLKAVGVAVRRIDNAAGAASAIRGEVEAGVFGPFVNSSAGDAIALADVGASCFIVDDETVAKTNGGSTRSVAGVVWDVTSEGVWVKFG